MDKEHFRQWPLALAAVTLMAAGITLDLTTQAAIAYGLWVLAAACLGAFVYAEGARHREWWDATIGKKQDQEPNQEDQT
mgnify:CR=1 FL=1